LAAAQTKPSAAKEKIGWNDRELKIKIGGTTSSFFYRERHDRCIHGLI